MQNSWKSGRFWDLPFISDFEWWLDQNFEIEKKKTTTTEIVQEVSINSSENNKFKSRQKCATK